MDSAYLKSLRETIKLCELVLNSDHINMIELKKEAAKVKAETEKNLKQYIAAQEATK